MPDCKQAPVDATLKANGTKLEVVSAITGGTCEKDEVLASIKKIHPTIIEATSVRVAREEQQPDVGNDVAKAFASTLNDRLESGLMIDVLGAPVDVQKNEVLGWLDFTSKDGAIVAMVNGDRAGVWLSKNIASKVAIAPGVSYVRTLDFTELSRVNGSEGRALDIAATVASVQAVVDGSAQNGSAATKSVPPTEQYTRTYSPSDAGLSALLANYAKDHSGTFGISMVELDGKKRRADYNGDKQFVTASTYKLFVAYSLLKQIDVGKRSWDSDATCFNKMISNSDNACAESFLNSLGLSTVTKDIQAIGLKNSTFMKTGGPFTTANDLSLLLGMIAMGQNFSPLNQQRLIAAMKANVYRKGIPAGVQGTVANKVGFMNGLLHDAAIMYGPNGTYVLAIMTDGSTWGNIAELAKQIDALRAE
jgi:beta-lactamase class A